MKNKLMLFAVIAIFVAMAIPVSASSFITTEAQPIATDIITSDYQQYEYMITHPSYTAYFNEKPLGAHFVKIIADKSQLNFKFYDPNPNNVDAIVNGKNIRYNSIATATDVWYDVGNDTVKETIKLYNTSGSIIKSRVQTELTPTIINGDILWKRGEETIFRMPRPYASDANDNYINGDYVLTQNGINWDIEISISTSWLANAVYPVEIDPSVKILSDSSNNQGYAGNPLVMDSSGNLFVAILNNTNRVIRIYNSSDNGVSWINFKNITNQTSPAAMGDPVLNILSNNNLVLVWSDASTKLYYSIFQRSGTDVKVPTLLFSGGSGTVDFDCDVNSTDFTWCIFDDTGATGGLVANYSTFNATGSIIVNNQLAYSPIANISFSTLRIDSSNNVHATLWDTTNLQLKYIKYTTSWSAPITIITNAGGVQSDIAIHPSQDKILVVKRGSTSDGVSHFLNFWNGSVWIYGTTGLNASNGTISGYSISGSMGTPAVAATITGTFYFGAMDNSTSGSRHEYSKTTDGITWTAWATDQVIDPSPLANYAPLNYRGSVYPSGNRVTSRLDGTVNQYNGTAYNFYYFSMTLNNPPVVTINYPTNTTYVASNITMNWTVTDDSTATLTCWRYLDGVQKYTGSIANGTTTNEFMSNVSIGSHNVSVTCQDGAPANTTATTYFSVLHWNETNQTFSNPVYETNLTNFNITFGIAGNVANITGNLTYNNTNYPATTTAVGSTFVLNVTNLRVPLVETNNTIKNFNWSYVVSYTNGTNTSAQTSTNYNHSVYWAYYITAIASPTTALELDNVTFNTTVATQLQVATLLTNTTFNGTAYTTSVVANSSTQRNYSTSIIMPNPPASSTLYVWNSTLYVSYANQSFARSSSNSNITVKQMILALCAGNATLPAFNFTFYTEEDDKIVNSTNLSSTANKFEATFWAFKNGSSYQRNYTFNLTGNVSYPICLEHNETSSLVDAHIRYYNTSYSTRNYFLENYTVDNVTDNISLYLLETTLSSPISFEIRESNGINPAAGVVIQALRFYPDKNVYRIVAMALTDGDGKGFSYLKMNTVFHKFRLYRDGEFMREIEQGVLGGADVAAGLTLTYSLTVTSLAEIMEIYEQVAGSCTSNNATAIVTCTYDDSSTHLQTMYLTIQKLSNVSWVSICTNSSITDNGTLTCSAASAGNGTYYYWLYGKFASSTLLTIKIADGSFNVGQLNIFGTAGLLFSAILIIALVMIGSFNPIVTIFMGITGLVVSSILGMLDISLAALVGIIIVGIIIAIKSRG